MQESINIKICRDRMQRSGQYQSLGTSHRISLQFPYLTCMIGVLSQCSDTTVTLLSSLACNLTLSGELLLLSRLMISEMGLEAR